jgi:hypothetical protein
MSIQAAKLAKQMLQRIQSCIKLRQVYGMLTSTSINLFANVWLEECSVL